jgi:hypothetical protein
MMIMQAHKASADIERNSRRGKPGFAKAYSFGLITAALFLLSWTGQFISQAIAIADEARQHGEEFLWSDFWPQFLASTFENWQSEFLQLIWQAVGLTLLFLWGSSQSKESDERIEAKLDALLEERGIDAGDISERVNSAV